MRSISIRRMVGLVAGLPAPTQLRISGFSDFAVLLDEDIGNLFRKPLIVLRGVGRAVVCEDILPSARGLRDLHVFSDPSLEEPQSLRASLHNLKLLQHFPMDVLPW